MDETARVALAHLIRTELAPDFDRIAAEFERLDTLAAEADTLRHRVQVLEGRAGVQVRGPKDGHRRRAAVVELRLQGHSLRAIEVMLGVSRRTIESDLKRAGVSKPPRDTVALDGKPVGRRALNGHSRA